MSVTGITISTVEQLTSRIEVSRGGRGQSVRGKVRVLVVDYSLGCLEFNRWKIDDSRYCVEC